MRKTGNFSPHSKHEILKIQKSRKFLSHSKHEILKMKKPIIISILLVIVALAIVYLILNNQQELKNQYDNLKNYLSTAEKKENVDDVPSSIIQDENQQGSQTEKSSAAGRGDPQSRTEQESKSGLSCVERQISYSIGKVSEEYICNQEQSGVCIDKTARCAAEINSFSESTSGIFYIKITFNELENNSNIIATETADSYVEASNTNRINAETTIIGENANKNLFCSYSTTEVPKEKICIVKDINN